VASGDGSLIKAPDSYYKERPSDPGGMDVGSGDEIVYSASQGDNVASNIDISGAAETPVNVDRPQAMTPPPGPKAAAPAPSADATLSNKVAPPAPKPAPPKPQPTTAAPAEPAAPTGAGGTIQLGAFSSQAKANSAWKSLSGRFTFLKGMSQSVLPVQSGDKTLYRLRASGADASSVCARLRTAGESCSVVG
jgi:cell division septation protein DedD